MKLFEYECTKCGKTFEALSTPEERQSHRCETCGEMAPRVFTAPKVFVERAGCVEGRSDEFWARADRHKEGQLKKRMDADREKTRFGDRETLQKLENAHQTYVRHGESQKAEEVAKKIEAK